MVAYGHCAIPGIADSRSFNVTSPLHDSATYAWFYRSQTRPMAIVFGKACMDLLISKLIQGQRCAWVSVWQIAGLLRHHLFYKSCRSLWGLSNLLFSLQFNHIIRSLMLYEFFVVARPATLWACLVALESTGANLSHAPPLWLPIDCPYCSLTREGEVP